MDIGFGCGLLNLTTETSIEQYAPTNSDAMKHRDWVYINCFDNHITFICSNIPAASAYGLYMSQVIIHSIACGSYHDYC